jgi:hypothetical protein
MPSNVRKVSDRYIIRPPLVGMVRVTAPSGLVVFQGRLDSPGAFVIDPPPPEGQQLTAVLVGDPILTATPRHASALA